jgi:hypothetical protein
MLSKLLYVSVFVLLVSAEVKKTNAREIGQKVRQAFATGLANAVENKDEIYKAVTGREIPEFFQKDEVKQTKNFLEERSKDMAVGYAVRSTWESLWPLLLFVFACGLVVRLFWVILRTKKLE